MHRTRVKDESNTRPPGLQEAVAPVNGAADGAPPVRA